MKYEQMREYKDKQFRRITGAKRAAFEKLVEILSAAGSGQEASSMIC